MMTLERDLAVTLSTMDDEGRAMRAVVEALAPVHRVCGVAVVADLPGGRREETRGHFAHAAHEALNSNAQGPADQTATVVPFGDEKGGQGAIALIEVGSTGSDTATACSLERIGMVLSATLLRIETSKRLDAALRDRDLLMREIRHRVRNSLQLVINMAPLMLTEAAHFDKDIVDDFEKRIAALISIHDMLSWTEAKDLVSARTYFWLLADALRRVTSDGIGTFISLYDSDDDPELPVDRATTIGLVVYELVVNSAKHSHGSPVRMDLRVWVEGSTLVLRYSDRHALAGAAQPEEAADIEAVYGAPDGETKGQGRELVCALLSRARGERSDDGCTPHCFEARFPLD